MKLKNIIKAMIIAVLAAALLFGCARPAEINYSEHLTLTATYPHSTESFTQGLFFHNGEMFESVGQYGSSAVFKNIVLENGEHGEEGVEG